MKAVKIGLTGGNGTKNVFIEHKKKRNNGEF